MTTLAAISKHLGLSMATVSRALNGYPEVNAKTRQRVVEAAEQLGYKPNSVAQRLATGKSKMVGIMLQSPDELVCAPTFLQELFYISNTLQAKGYDLLINSSTMGDNVEGLKNFVAKSAIDGLIVKAPLVNDERIKFLIEKNIPFVVHGHDTSALEYAYYDIDNSSISSKAVAHLSELGHERIVLINGDEKQAFAKKRSDSFIQAVVENNLNAEQCRVLHCAASVRDGENLAKQLLGGKDKPTAIICYSSKVAHGIYTIAKEMGLTIGADLSVIAHDDGVAHFETEKFEPPMTVTCAPLTNSSEPIAEAIIQLISGELPAKLQTLMPVELVIRESTGTPRN